MEQGVVSLGNWPLQRGRYFSKVSVDFMKYLFVSWLVVAALLGGLFAYQHHGQILSPTAAVVNHDVFISWVAPTSGQVPVSYNVYVSVLACHSPFGTPTNTPNLTLTYLGVSSGTYYYWVTSVGSGAVESTPTDCATAVVP